MIDRWRLRTAAAALSRVDRLLAGVRDGDESATNRARCFLIAVARLDGGSLLAAALRGVAEHLESEVARAAGE